MLELANKDIKTDTINSIPHVQVNIESGHMRRKMENIKKDPN